MSLLTHHPVGTPVPDTPHAVCSSLPTMADVIAYEESQARILQALKAGYPRFIRHPLVLQAAQVLAQENNLATSQVVPLASQRLASALAKFLGLPQTRVLEHAGVSALAIPEDPEQATRAKRFLQHTGSGLSSRAAEDFLVRTGYIAGTHPEALASDAVEAENDLRAAVSRYTGAAPEDLIPCASGMNAFYSLVHAIDRVQGPRGRTLWLQWGWAYVDTTEVLRKFTSGGENGLLQVVRIDDFEAVEKIFRQHGAQLAGVIAEAPTNPLLQSGNCRRLSELCYQHGACLVLDPSTVGLANLRLLEYADVVTSSLTKYWANEGDVMAGLLAFNAASPFHADLRAAFGQGHLPLYERDLRRLAQQIPGMPEVVQAINANTRELVPWLESLPEVKAVHWAGEASTAAELAALDTSWGPGSLVTIEIEGALERFFDALRLVKGPSFGLRFSLSCPFMYLAHYPQASTSQGRRELLAQGLNPDLIRLSVGTESQSEIRAAITDGVTALRNNTR